MTTTTTLLADLIREETSLAATEYLIETNAGTYGPIEACRKVGCSEPALADQNVYETVGGKRRETGPGADRAPGHTRYLNGRLLAKARKRLVELRKAIRLARREQS